MSGTNILETGEQGLINTRIWRKYASKEGPIPKENWDAFIREFEEAQSPLQDEESIPDFFRQIKHRRSTQSF